MNRILDFLYTSFRYWDRNNYRHPLVTPIVELRGKNLESKNCFQHFITVDISEDMKLKVYILSLTFLII